MPFIPLLLAAGLWVGWHVGLAGTSLRGRAVALLGGDFRFTVAFSIGSVVSLTLLVMAWQRAPTEVLWFAPRELRWVLALLMLPAFMLFIASVRSANPTATGGKMGPEGPRGITRITRHPMLWALSIWAGVHMLGKGDVASVIFFGAFLVTALVGMPSIDAKLRARQPELWARLAPTTSILPFGAILARGGRPDWAGLGPLPPVLGTLAWVALLILHASFFGVPAVY